MSETHKNDFDFGFADLGRIRLHYAMAGKGDQLVILLHGFPEFWYSWRNQLSDLSDEFTVVAPDMRGYNLSDKPGSVSDYLVEEIVDDIAGLVKFFGFESAAIVGHDWGAGIAWGISQQRPEILSKLACLQVPPPVIWKKNQSIKQLLASWYMFFFQLPLIPEWLLKASDYRKLAVSLKTTTAEKGVFTDEDIEKYKEAWNRPGALTGGLNYYRANIMKRIFGKPLPMKKIEVPTLFIYGEKDTAILPATVAGVGDVIDGDYTELRIPESGHWVQIEARQKVSAVLKNFLSS